MSTANISKPNVDPPSSTSSVEAPRNGLTATLVKTRSPLGTMLSIIFQAILILSALSFIVLIWQKERIDKLFKQLDAIVESSHDKSMAQKLDEINAAQNAILKNQAESSERVKKLEAKQAEINQILTEQTLTLAKNQKEFSDKIELQYWKLTALSNTLLTIDEQMSRTIPQISSEISAVDKTTRDARNIIMLMDASSKLSKKQ